MSARLGGAVRSCLGEPSQFPLDGAALVGGVTSGVYGSVVNGSVADVTATIEGASHLAEHLARCRATRTGAISDCSYVGGTSLELEDIAYVGGKQARYAGTSKAAVLTVTDGLTPRRRR